jgi:hypothetical protein
MYVKALLKKKIHLEYFSFIYLGDFLHCAKFENYYMNGKSLQREKEERQGREMIIKLYCCLKKNQIFTKMVKVLVEII